MSKKQKAFNNLLFIENIMPKRVNNKLINYNESIFENNIKKSKHNIYIIAYNKYRYIKQH